MPGFRSILETLLLAALVVAWAVAWPELRRSGVFPSWGAGPRRRRRR